MATLFTRIILGEIPAYKIAENDQFLAFLDVFPLVEGHVLVIPKLEVDNLFDLKPLVLQQLFGFAQQVAKAIEKTVECRKVGVAVIGLEVPHAHIHLVPINEVGDINFSRPKMQVSAEQLSAMQARLVAAF
jgi:histidine triad (HIT) family protein